MNPRSFVYGLNADLSDGIVIKLSKVSAVPKNEVQFHHDLKNLKPGITYFWCGEINNSNGTAKRKIQSFKTKN